ncbi:MAG: VCBS repeat-containing protein, partial [Acidobacteria bacterium]|nr:VCBS repeat-containing protein [Acidobacteriota bacterium]
FRSGETALEAAGTKLAEGSFTAVAAFDGDLDGRLDLAAVGQGSFVLLHQVVDGSFQTVPVPQLPADLSSLAVLDDDGDGDPDLFLSGEAGLFRLTNQGASGHGWLSLRLRGLDQGNSKNNLLGLGSTVEVFAGNAYQFFEAGSDLTLIGLGQVEAADVLRVVWTNGVPQNRLQVRGRQTVMEEQILKGSCPFLYAWDGKSMRFVTDLLWGAPLGMPVAPGVWAGADPQELVRVDGLALQEGKYELRITEELWEAAFFDLARLWVVDHPQEVEVASSLLIELGRQVEDRVLASRGLRPLAAAWDGGGREVTGRVRDRDEVYADGYRKSPYQGVATEPWTFTMDLGEAPGRAIRFHLDGWIFPADASLNLALAQRSDLAWTPPRLEVETVGGWQELMPAMGFPAGKTKTLVIDTPPLPNGARRLRIVTTQWLSWDRIAWTVEPADDEPRLLARLEPSQAELRFRGFSRARRSAPNGPHVFDYQTVTTESPWLPFPGSYTRFGDVRELLGEADDRSVILAPGDEIGLTFDASSLPPVPEGWRRTVFLESHGWDKDADRNTYAAQGVEPLPFRAMSGYPYGEGEAPPEHFEEYRREWLTRRISGPAGPAGDR